MADETGYDELAVLTDYIWKNFRRLMTDDEKLAEHALTAEAKFTSVLDPTVIKPRLIIERKKYQDNAFVQWVL